MRRILSSLLRYAYIPLLSFAAILQVTIMPDFQIGDGRADLVLTLVLSWTLLAGNGEGVSWALVAGLAQDLLTGVPLGVSALALAIVAFAIGQLIRPLERAGLLLSPLIVAIGTAGYHLTLIGLYVITQQSVSIVYSLLHATLPGMALNALITVPIIFVLARLRRALTPRRVSTLITN